MAEHFRFFDSTIDDERLYTADEWAEVIRQLVTNGIYNGGTNLQVRASGSNMMVEILDGFAWINGYLYKVADGASLELSKSDNSFDRIDRIVIRWDVREESRFIKAFVVKGVPAENPVAPALTRTDEIYELSLAQVRVKAGRTFITGDAVTDERLNTAVCGISNSRIQADTTEIFNQFQEWYNTKTPDFEKQFNDWLVTLQGKLQDDAIAGHITDVKSHIPFAVATGTANNYKVTLEGVVAYVDGLGVSFSVPTNATGATTLSINDLVAVPIIKANGGAVNNLKANGVYTVRYNKGNFTLQGEGGEYGNANADQVLKGVTIGTENGLVTGTMPNRSAEAFHQLTKGVSAVAGDKVYLKPPNGYYDGESWVYSAQPDLQPNNMLAGKSVFGIAGNIPNYGRAVLGQGYKNPKSYRADGGGSLVVEPLRGYYEEGLNANNFGSIILNDPNFIAANIKAGKSIFGINGTVDPSKIAYGTSTPLGGVNQHYVKLGGSFYYFNELHITGLSFRPRFVIAFADGATQRNIMTLVMPAGYNRYNLAVPTVLSLSYSTTTAPNSNNNFSTELNLTATSGKQPFQISDTGIIIPCSQDVHYGNFPMNWVAIG